jgi:UPF0716 protein FxsA
VLLFVLLLLVVPFVEIFVFVQVATWIGVLDAMGLLLLISLVGVGIVWKQGSSAWRRIRNELATGKVPGAALIDGGLIFFAGVLLIIPGYVSDACGLLLLVPPVRAGVRGMLRRRYTVQVGSATEPWSSSSTSTPRPPEPPAIDV